MITQTLKGFRDFLPKEAKKRQFVIDTLKKVFESYGFEPLETPALEYEEVLLGKYGDEGDKLMYRFIDNGDRKVAMRYDQTVPLARVIAQYGSELPMPFKRYQMQNVWRAENTQKGRYREFLQCDADIVGTSSPLADAEIIAMSAKAVLALGFRNYKILINDRAVFNDIPKEAITAIDKLKKIGRDGVLSEMNQKGIKDAGSLLECIESAKPTERISEILKNLEKLGIDKAKYSFEPTLARGLDYYTGLIFEIEIEEYTQGSVCGGGRYDELIGMFARSASFGNAQDKSSGQAGRDIPAVGFAFGFDRLMEAMSDMNLFPSVLNSTQVLVTIFSPDLKDTSIEIANQLREEKINTQLYLDENTSLQKQLKYADAKDIPFVVVIGPQEKEKNMITLKNMKTRKQSLITLKNLASEISAM